MCAHDEVLAWWLTSCGDDGARNAIVANICGNIKDLFTCLEGLRHTRRHQMMKIYQLWQWLHAWWSRLGCDSSRAKIEARSAIDSRPVLGGFGSVVCLTKTCEFESSLDLLENTSFQTKDSWISVNRWQNGLGDQLTHIWHCFQSFVRNRVAVNHFELKRALFYVNQCYQN